MYVSISTLSILKQYGDVDAAHMIQEASIANMLLPIGTIAIPRSKGRHLELVSMSMKDFRTMTGKVKR